jgi:hypothetical protein
MTADELALHFNRTFGSGAWPATYVVDFETYGQVAHKLFTRYYDSTEHSEISFGDDPNWQLGDTADLVSICLHVGPHKGLLFKNVELLPQAQP